MTFTSTELIAIIVALGAVVVNIITALRTGSKVDSIAQVTAKSLVETTVLQGQVKEVHVLTNQNLSDVRNELKTSNAEIAALREVVSDLRGQREKASMADAFKTPAPGGGGTARRSTDQVTADNPMPVEVIAKDPIPVEVKDHPVVEKKPAKK